MKKIQVESPMRKASEDRVVTYQPVYDCLPLLPEDGSGQSSYTNLIRLKEHGLHVVGTDVTATGVFVVFETGETYFATGFKIVAENDDRTMHFAQFLADCVGGDADGNIYFYRDTRLILSEESI